MKKTGKMKTSFERPVCVGILALVIIGLWMSGVSQHEQIAGKHDIPETIFSMAKG